MRAVLSFAALMALIGCSASSGKSTGPQNTSSTVSTATASAVTSTEVDEPPLADDEIRISKHYPQAGDVVTRASERTTSLKGTLRDSRGAKPLDMKSVAPFHVEEACIAASDNRCVKLRVTYGKVAMIVTNDGKQQTTLLPVAGKSYMVERREDGPLITLADGSEPSPDEADYVAEQYGGPSQTREILDALPSRVRVGSSLDSVASVLGKMRLEDDSGKSKIRVEVKVKSIRKAEKHPIVVLDVRVMVEPENKNDKGTAMDLAGTIELRADGGHPVMSELNGTVSVSFGEHGSAAGSFRSFEQVAYSW